MSNPYESTDTAPMFPRSSTLQIRSIGVLSCAKLMGALYGILGLIGGAIVTLFTMAGAAFAPNGNGATALGVGAAAIVMAPIMYGVAGFIGGLIMGFFYNIVASVVGGIEIRTSLLDQS